MCYNICKYYECLREGYAKLPESFHKFVEMFVLLDKKIKELILLFDVMYNPKKGRNKDVRRTF